MKSDANPFLLGKSLRTMYIGQLVSLSSVAVSILSIFIMIFAVIGATGGMIGAYSMASSDGLFGFMAGIVAAASVAAAFVGVLGMVGIGLCVAGSVLNAYGLYTASTAGNMFKTPFYMGATCAALSILQLVFSDSTVGVLCSIATLILPMALAVSVGYNIVEAMSGWGKTEGNCKRVRMVTMAIRMRYIRFGIFMASGIALLMLGFIILAAGNVVFSGIILLGCLAAFIIAGYMWVRATLSYLFDILRESRLVCEAVVAHSFDADVQPSEIVVTRVARDGTVTETMEPCGGSDNAEKE